MPKEGLHTAWLRGKSVRKNKPRVGAPVLGSQREELRARQLGGSPGLLVG